MDIHPADIAIAIINIIVLFVLLRQILWKPVNVFLTARSERISSDIEKAIAIRDEAEKIQLTYEQKLKDAEAEAKEILRESQTQASKEAEAMIEEARQESEAIMQEAHERIAQERERAILDSRREVAQLATDIASGILKRQVSSVDAESVVEEFFLEMR